ncbi:PilZ domain-containing protein [Colwellia demingiae]|uniref:PilZ domain-containing protein n=1 Tax=Colwellia demingiae TaxID=89401 RepID=A0A5C6QRV0_9GAMM|nr:PilZ domain-containing protein [Colwellia demingiae]TWX71795.1 PilZ domain-containing protein [Colwellia demingiae]
MKDFDDKRDFYRMMLNSEVVVTVIDDEVNSQLSATCRDLSATGMAFEIEHPLAISTHVKVRVDSASSQIQALDIRGRVVRIEEESKNCYLIGITIEEID